jgi:hypothetical protein
MKTLIIISLLMGTLIYPQNIKEIKYKTVIDKGTFHYRLTNGKEGKSTVKWIVVSPKSTKAEVKKLVDKLLSQYQSSDWISINIFTNEKIAINHDTCSNYDFDKSCLVIINKDATEYQPAFYRLK